MSSPQPPLSVGCVQNAAEDAESKAHKKKNRAGAPPCECSCASCRDRVQVREKWFRTCAAEERGCSLLVVIERGEKGTACQTGECAVVGRQEGTEARPVPNDFCIQSPVL